MDSAVMFDVYYFVLASNKQKDFFPEISII